MQQSKRINGHNFNTYLAGSGEALLFVHGFPLNHTMWSSQIAEFSKDFLVIAPDLRGFGASTGEDSTSTSMREFADDLSDLIEELNVEQPVHFCGLSMGGYIAWQFVQHHAEKLRSLILCDTKAAADTDDAKQTRRETAAKVLQEGPDFLAESMVEKLFSSETLQKNVDVVTQTQSVIRKTNRQSISAALLGMADRPDMSSILPRINAPSLVVVGEEDSITTRDEMLQISEQIPRADFVEVKDAGHMAPLEKPKFVNAAIRKFLKNQV